MSLVFHGPQSAGELLDVSLGVVKRHAGPLLRIGIGPTLAIPLFFGSAFGLLYLIYHGVLSTALYANARVRNEGYDVEDLLPVTTGAAG